MRCMGADWEGAPMHQPTFATVEFEQKKSKRRRELFLEHLDAHALAAEPQQVGGGQQLRLGRCGHVPPAPVPPRSTGPGYDRPARVRSRNERDRHALRQAAKQPLPLMSRALSSSLGQLRFDDYDWRELDWHSRAPALTLSTRCRRRCARGRRQGAPQCPARRCTPGSRSPP